MLRPDEREGVGFGGSAGRPLVIDLETAGSGPIFVCREVLDRYCNKFRTAAQ
jgi:hypothetical protein